jgi:hypothetical protein
MSCKSAYYKDIVDYIGVCFGVLKVYCFQYVGVEWIVWPILAVLVAPFAFLFVWSQILVIPKFTRWYYEVHLLQKAKDWFNDSGLSFLGFKYTTAVISVIAGAVFYALMRAIIAFPSYLPFSLIIIPLALIGIGVLSYFVSGNVPYDEKYQHSRVDPHRFRYFKRFCVPAVTATGLALLNLGVDVLIGAASITMRLLGFA